MNKNILKIHQGILDNDRAQVLEKLVPISKGFVLGGGTALALQIAHRKSYDFDFFSQSQVAKNYLEKLSREFPIANIAVDSNRIPTPEEVKHFFEKLVREYV